VSGHPNLEERSVIELPPGTVRRVTDAEVEAYRRDGWVKLEGLVDPDFTIRMLRVAKEIMGESGTEAEVRPGIDVDFSQWHDRHWLAREQVEPFASLAYSAEMGRNAQRFTERPVAIRYWSDMLACRPPVEHGGRVGPTPAHQDHPGSQFDRVGNTSFWIALDDVPAERGTVRYRSGSHREGPLGRSFLTYDGATTQLDDVYPWLADRYPLCEPYDMQAGDATCHSQLVVHTGPVNRTDKPRWVFIAVYFPADTLYTGAPFHGRAGVELAIDQPFDHDLWPIVAEHA
jgi:hypothetical protein